MTQVIGFQISQETIFGFRALKSWETIGNFLGSVKTSHFLYLNDTGHRISNFTGNYFWVPCPKIMGTHENKSWEPSSYTIMALNCQKAMQVGVMGLFF